MAQPREAHSVRTERFRSPAWRLLAGIVLLALVLWRLGPAEVLRATRAMSVDVLVPALLLAMLPPLCHAWRWHRLLETVQQRIPFLDAVRVTVAASTANYLLPAFGWAPAKVVTSRRWLGIGVERSLPTLVIEQALDLGVLAFCAAIGLWRSGSVPRALVSASFFRERSVLGILVLAGVAGAVLVAALSARVRRFGRGVMTSGQRIVRVAWRDPVVWSTTSGRWGAELLLLALLVHAAQLPFGWGDLLVLLGAPGIVGALSPIPGGLGVREATGVLLAGWLAWDPPTVGAVLAWQRLMTVLGLGLVGVGTSLVRRAQS